MSYENPSPNPADFFDIAPGNDSTGLPGSGGKGAVDPSQPSTDVFGSPVPDNTGVRPSAATPGPRADDHGSVTATDPFGHAGSNDAVKSGSTGTTFANGGMAGFLGAPDNSGDFQATGGLVDAGTDQVVIDGND